MVQMLCMGKQQVKEIKSGLVANYADSTYDSENKRAELTNLPARKNITCLSVGDAPFGGQAGEGHLFCSTLCGNDGDWIWATGIPFLRSGNNCDLHWE